MKKSIAACFLLLFMNVVMMNCNNIGSTDGSDGASNNSVGNISSDSSTNGTDEQGNITSDTTWTSGSTHVIEREIVVKENVKLTVEPGTIISLNPYTQIFIDGTLNAQGTSLNHIIIKNEGTLGGGGLRFTSTSKSSIMRYVEIQNNGLSVDNGNLDIQYCKFINSKGGNNFWGFSANSNDGIGSYTISNCSLIGNNTSTYPYSYGISLAAATGKTININNCIITNHSNGIYLSTPATVILTGCSVINNTVYGIGTYSGIVTINNSNIYGNTTYDYQNLNTTNQNAKSNWWGTTNTTTINSKIYDKNDVSSYGTVDYSSYLSSEVKVTGCGW
jgi:hypothetical protein